MVNQKGLTLVEVLASLAIISIVLLSFFQLFINTSVNTVKNNEKLVMIYLAEAELERLKINPFEHIDKIEKDSNLLYNTSFTREIKLNDENYKIVTYTFQDMREKELQIFNAKVEIKSLSSQNNSSVEGYVVYE
ncbi:prepilin-type N-terminal cleavage/methylation domain-containing protein [Psychrobacillus sp. FSL K6-4046]|uniref:type IV pilus modification PilV family protein n=1 Tax=unclassified Psychrobacillus TaxID=2636677 RepID=UPI00203E122A|nr:prepilin-type N-terminal cleavage/methylation domain-containing protein [Psychrobacillus sp. MER TA 171]MCM3357813.1 prepilin-type N-terminal cleavage/methylation domain-containing protein [Psychrobacillus sp. MER TA 171]